MGGGIQIIGNIIIEYTSFPQIIASSIRIFNYLEASKASLIEILILLLGHNMQEFSNESSTNINLAYQSQS